MCGDPFDLSSFGEEIGWEPLDRVQFLSEFYGFRFSMQRGPRVQTCFKRDVGFNCLWT